MKTQYFNARFSPPFCHSSTSGAAEQIPGRRSSPNSVADHYKVVRIRLRRNSKVKEEEANGAVEKLIQSQHLEKKKKQQKETLKGKKLFWKEGMSKCYYKVEKPLLKQTAYYNMYSSEYEKDKAEITRFSWIFKEIYSLLNRKKKRMCSL